MDSGLPVDAVSRAYYAVLHAARAALMSKGVAASTHAGVWRQFGKEFVGTGEVEAEWAKTLAPVQSASERADYDTAADLPEQ